MAVHHTAQHSDGVDASGQSLTYVAALRLQRIRDHDLSPTVQKKAILCLIDYLGALISGLSSDWSGSLLQWAKISSPSGGPAHVMGLAGPVSAETAAFANASIAHSIIRDDMHLSAGSHIGAMVIPAAIALAERDNWNGKQLLKSIVAGYDMAEVLGSSLRTGGTCNPHFRPSGIIGAFAAAGAGIAGSGDPRITATTGANALGFAANMAAGLNEWPWAGGMEITTHMGTASRSGVTSCELARAGMFSSDTILEGKDGMFQAYTRSAAEACSWFRKWLSTADIGTGIMGAKFKPVSGCNFVQTPVATALRMHDKVKGSVNLIENVKIVTTTGAKEYPGCNYRGPFQKVQQTKMSLQYAVSAAILFGCVDEDVYRQYTDEHLDRVIQHCDVETNARFDEDLVSGRQPCKIEIHLKGGETIADSLPDVPWLEGRAAVEERFKQEAGPIFGAEMTKIIIDECQSLGQSTAGCSRLFAVLAGETP